MKQLITLLILLPFMAISQFTDDFSDGDFNLNPQWTGNVSKFKINSSLQLQLNDDDAGTAVLFTKSHSVVNTEWRFYIKLSFSPSANNNARVYLSADTNVFSLIKNGYFLQFGEAGGNDAIELFKFIDGNEISVCRGADGLISSSFNLDIKIVNQNNQWQIFSKIPDESFYSFYAEGADNEPVNGNSFGVFCKYTSSNSSKFYFDNFYVGEIYVDNEPPCLKLLNLTSDSSMMLTFSEFIDTNSAEKTTNYFVNKNVGSPANARLHTSDGASVILEFNSKFENKIPYNLHISNISDLNGNIISDMDTMFTYFAPDYNDIYINEIMADPYPVVALPEWEYVEIYNNSGVDINLKDWVLRIGETNKVFDSVFIKAGNYLLISDDNAIEELSGFSQVYGFGSFSLSNSGKELMLLSPSGKIISNVKYTDEWYGDEEKADGGWSLELINYENICSGAENWSASHDIRGGSPGRVNSIAGNSIFYPVLSRLEVLDSLKLQLEFNQKMDSLSMSEVSNFNVENNTIYQAFYSGFKPNKVVLKFDDYFEKSTVYNLLVSRNLENCIGLKNAHDTIIEFGLPEKAEKSDIVINEILFNPLGDGVDYIELYNNSFKILDLSDYSISSVYQSPPAQPDTSSYNITEEKLMFMPASYICLSPNPASTLEQYYSSNQEGILKMYPFPSMNNEYGEIIVYGTNNRIIDYFRYNEDMHFPLLKSVEGVSLERISPIVETNNTNNWHSAAESVGFGTPAYENSQYYPLELNDEISIEPEIFSPDGDTYNDVLSINYSFSHPDNVINVIIFNSNGYRIRHLVNNEYVGQNGGFFWDGIDENNSRSPVGIYIIYVEVFDINGNVRKYKKSAVLALPL